LRHKINPDDDFDNMMKPIEVGKFVCDLIDKGDYLDNQVLKVLKVR
jgi:hypothetical protein